MGLKDVMLLLGAWLNHTNGWTVVQVLATRWDRTSSKNHVKKLHSILRYEECSWGFIASFQGSCAGEEERQPGTHCLSMCQVPLAICILLCYTKIMINFCLPAERQGSSPYETHRSCFEVKNNIALTVMVCIALFKMIGEIQSEKLCQSCAAAFNWNGQTCGQFLQAKS